MKNWISLFWTYESEIPAGMGFPIFEKAHWLWLAGLLLVSLILLKLAAGRSAVFGEKLAHILGWSLLAMELYRDVVLILIGHYGIYELPLHLCSMAGFLCTLHMLFHKEWMGQVLYTLCLPGAMAALLFPDWVTYPPIHFMTIHGFVFHGTVVLYICLALLRRDIIPSLRALWKPMIFLCVIVPPIYVFNKIVRANYLFINVPSPGSPLVLLEKWFGNPGYLVAYGAVILLVMLGMDVGYMMCNHPLFNSH